jgi:hypothetical protein
MGLRLLSRRQEAPILDSFKRHRALAHHFIDSRNQLADFLFRVDHFDEHRKIATEAKDFGNVDLVMRAEALDASEDRRPGHALMPKQLHNRRVQWTTVPAISFSDEDPQELPCYEVGHCIFLPQSVLTAAVAARRALFWVTALRTGTTNHED